MDRSQYNREYYLRTRDRQLARAKTYYQENKVARREYHKNYYANHRNQENDRMKAERQRKSAIKNRIALHYGCRNPSCQWRGPFYACQLDFHHFDQKDKQGHLGQMRTVCIERFIAEINKCVVLCKCCHALFHKGAFHLNEALKCDVDPATCLPRTPNIAEDDAGIRATLSRHHDLRRTTTSGAKSR